MWLGQGLVWDFLADCATYFDGGIRFSKSRKGQGCECCSNDNEASRYRIYSRLIRLIRCNRDWVSVSVFLLGKDELARFLV